MVHYYKIFNEKHKADEMLFHEEPLILTNSLSEA